MRLEIRGRNVEMTNDLRELVRKRFGGVGRQLSGLASVDVVLHEERNPSISDRQVAEATVRMKGTTLHAREASPEMSLSIHKLSEDVARQVKKQREMSRKRKVTRRALGQMRGRPAV
jgi:putative sigma-54 modulation protein